MFQSKSGKPVNVVAFYLPQFHPIPENDKYYGKGFVEWVNTKKAKPLYDGHYQPRTPLNHNYYDLRNIDVMVQQSEMAQSYGVSGFCYYHYWFKNGKKLLEKPVENMLSHKEVDIPFCLSWANENWSKKWDGGNNEIIVEQDYGNIKDWELHFQYLLQFFNDDRYIYADDKPLLLIYRPEIIPNLRKMLSYFRKRAIESGLAGLSIVSQYPAYYIGGGQKKYFDYFVEFEPLFTRQCEEAKDMNAIKRTIRKLIFSLDKEIFIQKYHALFDRTSKKQAELTRCDYSETWNKILDLNINNRKFIRGCFVDWDNTPRNKNGMSYVGATPDKFQIYFNELINIIKKSKNPDVVFINAWNEWAEGAYLEPDEKYQYSYLEAIKKVIKQ